MSSNRVKKDTRARMRETGGGYQKTRDEILFEETSEPTSKPAAFDPSPFVERWAKNEHTEDLTIPIGFKFDSNLNREPRTVSLNFIEASRGGTGPHGCLQGMTGMGKSHFLRNIVTALCSTYSPTKVNIAALDFKTASFEGLDKYPHIIANLSRLEEQRELIDRFMDTIDGEIHRRERTLFDARCKDILEYRKKMAKDPTLEPLPFLFVVADEFHEFMRSNKDKLSLFTRIAAKGRSLGIHLLISSQFIDAGLLSNIMNHFTYGISLKSANQFQSRTVLGGDSSAAQLRKPGQAMLCYVDTDTGNNRIVSLEVFHPAELDLALGNVLFDNVETDVPVMGEREQNHASGWVIGGTDAAPVCVPEQRNILVEGSSKCGKSTAILSMIAASAIRCAHGKENSIWFVLDGDGSLEGASSFQSVHVYMSNSDLEDEDKVRRAVDEIPQYFSGNMTGDPSRYVVVNNITNESVLNALKPFADTDNVFFVSEKTEVVGKRPYTLLNLVSISSDSESSDEAGFICGKDAGEWRRVSLPILSKGMDSDGGTAALGESIPFPHSVHRVFYTEDVSHEEIKGVSGSSFVVGTVPFTLDAVEIPIPIGHVSIVGKKGMGTTTALRTCVSAALHNVSPNSAEFYVVDCDIELTGTVHRLIDGGYMGKFEYAVNIEEWRDIRDRMRDTIMSRIPTRDVVLRGRNKGGKWYEGKDVYLVLNNPSWVIQGDVAEWYGLLDDYDVGVHILMATPKTRSGNIRDTTFIRMYGGEETSLSSKRDYPTAPIPGRAHLSYIADGKEVVKPVQIALPSV
jgi:hypothetical protein